MKVIDNIYVYTVSSAISACVPPFGTISMVKDIFTSTCVPVTI